MDTNKNIVKEQDERIARLERQLAELTNAQQQSAATIASNHHSKSASISKNIFRSLVKASIFVLLVFVSIVAGRLWVLSTDTPKQQTTVFVEHVQELSTLATAKAHMKAVLQEEDNQLLGKDLPIDIPGTKRKLLIVVPATVIAGVDLKGITSKDMVINEETKEINITLPHAELIQEPSIQVNKIQKIVDGEFLREDPEWDKGFSLLAEAQEQVRQEAISEGLLNTAEENAEKVLKEFFKNIGYTTTVTFN